MFGNQIFQTGTTYLATTSSAPTYDLTNGAYTSILPNTGNETPMTFTVSYKLISEDTQEVIEVTDRQVTVPAAYCQWKPNFAYTYLFKISDQSAQLYPITFDAVVAEDEVSKQETITEVAGDTENVSITTIGFNGNTVVTSTTANEYASGNTIYASVMKGSTAEQLSVASSNTNIALYTVVASGTVTPNITEATVANCIKNGAASAQGNNDKVVKDINGGTLTATPVTIAASGDTAPCIVSVVPREDGNGNRNISALKWTGVASTTYAVEYTTGTGNDAKKYYKIVLVK